MFCSGCRSIKTHIDDEKRKFCNSGHMFCSECGKESKEKCQICGDDVVHLFYIIFHDDNIPRFVISPIEDTKVESRKESNEEEDKKSNISLESIDEMIRELNEYDNKCNELKIENISHPKIGPYQVLAHSNFKLPVSYTLSLDGEEEEEFIMQNFKVVERRKSADHYPTSGEGDGNSLTVCKPSSESSFTRTHSPTYSTKSGCCESQKSFSYVESAIQIFKNQKSFNSSIFTALSPPQRELSPPPTIVKETPIPSNAQRVNFTPVYECDVKIPAQMEPLGFFNNADIESVSEDLNSTLSRMPVSCPITTCRTSSLPSNFYNHFVNDHPYIGIVKMTTQKLANFSISPAGILVMSHRMFLLEGKLQNIGYGIHENCLPIIICSAKLTMQQILGIPTRSSRADEVFCIWPLSIFEHPVKYSLNVWSHGESILIKSISSFVPYLSSSQNLHDIFNNSLVLNMPMMEKLTSNDSQISCQIIFN